jgi:hypothetical protein
MVARHIVNCTKEPSHIIIRVIGVEGYGRGLGLNPGVGTGVEGWG